MKRVIILMALIMMPLVLFSQEAKFKATFTLNFIRYIGWPESSMKGDFVIGVLKNKEVAEQLREQAAGKKFGFQDVIIKEFKTVEEVGPCQVIFVGAYANFAKNAPPIISKSGRNTLIITEAEGATEFGSVINFVIREDKLKFELHKVNAGKCGLQISSKLEGMASAINL